MTVNIIHLEGRIDRLKSFENQLFTQNVSSYKLWQGVVIKDNPKQGIAKAHKQIVDWARVQDLPEVLIAEDDVCFTAPDAFMYFLNRKPTDFDLYLGGIVYGKLSEDNITCDFSGLHFYVINKRFYDQFLALPETSDIDRALANKGRYVVCNPFVAIQTNGVSDNSGKHVNFEVFLRGRKLFGT